MRVGVLALQGDFREHIGLLRTLGADAFPVRKATELALASGLVIPGGESTAISKLAVSFGLLPALREYRSSHPVLGTCAGLILLSDRVEGLLPDQQLIGGLPIAVSRNAYGGQVHSFETDIEVLGENQRVAFIRAPKILDSGPCEILASFEGEPVAVRHGNLFGASFHPEVTGATKLHEAFLEQIAGN